MSGGSQNVSHTRAVSRRSNKELVQVNVADTSIAIGCLSLDFVITTWRVPSSKELGPTSMTSLHKGGSIKSIDRTNPSWRKGFDHCSDLSIDWTLLDTLQKRKLINWCRTASILYPVPLTSSEKSQIRLNMAARSLLRSIAVTITGLFDENFMEQLRALAFELMASDCRVTSDLIRRRAADNKAICGSHSTGTAMTTRCSDAEWLLLCSMFDLESASNVSNKGQNRQLLRSIEPIHLFTLSIVIRRPLIVLQQATDDSSQQLQQLQQCQSQLITASDMSSASNTQANLRGIYLPVLHDVINCCRYPIILFASTKYGDVEFTPLLESCLGNEATRSRDIQPCRTFPLTSYTMEQLPVRCCLESVDIIAQNLLKIYLDTFELPSTSHSGLNVIPSARLGDLMPIVREGPGLPSKSFSGADKTTDKPPTDASRCTQRGCNYFGLQQYGGKCHWCSLTTTASRPLSSKD